jgi:ADP-ribosylglycohydrolase
MSTTHDPEAQSLVAQRAPKTVHTDRGRGALLGLAVGDALGTTLEFATGYPAPFPELARGPHKDITGGGPYRLVAGQVTDDTHMATCLAGSLMERGDFDADAVAAAYVEWRRHTFDIGDQTGEALARVESGTPASQAGREVWLAHDRQPAANGSLMRTAPIAVFFHTDPSRRRTVSMADSAITHFDPRCQLACAAFNAAVAISLGADPATPATMVLAAQSELGLATEQLADACPEERDAVLSARDALLRDLLAAGQPDPDLYGREVHLVRMQGYVRVAFRLAFWHLLHTDDFEAALVDVVNRGADADTNGAITGALLGARLGEGGIPEPWRRAVLDALAGGDSVFARDYHPRRLLELMP